MVQRQTWNFKLTGKPAVAALVLIVLVGGLGMFARGEVDDPALEDALRAELVLRLGGRTGQELGQLSENPTEEEVRAFLERADADGIEIHSTKVSGPVGSSAGSSYDVAVIFEYTLPGEPRQEAVWLMEKRIGSWRYRRETGKMTYYMNLF